MPEKPPINPRGADVELTVRVQPKSSRNAVRIEADGVLRVSVTAPPESGKANRAVISFLAKRLGVAKSRVELLSGERGRLKRLLIYGVSADDVRRAIAK